jgi:retinal rod rhodopsin-sensitive cGMP 3',5'-cyclic phosphodiesterase subunit delta
MSDTTQQKIQLIKSGFKINHMKMKNGENGETLWSCEEYNLEDENTSQNLPKEILECSVITREINFSSLQAIDNLELIQNFYLNEELIESSRFYFGFVIPNSTNNWEQVIEAKPKEEMIPYQILSGHLLVETIFISSNAVVFKNRCLIYYV